MNDIGITAIEDLRKNLEDNRDRTYCVGDWVYAPIDGKKVPVKITSIHHNGIQVSNSRYVKLSLVDADSILERLFLLLSTSRANYSTTPAICVQYASLLIELDNAIVRFHIDYEIFKKMRFMPQKNGEASSSLPFMKVNYKDWADKIKEQAKFWTYSDFEGTNDVCYFNPGFDYEQFLSNHSLYWHAVNDKINYFCKILLDIHNCLSPIPGYKQTTPKISKKKDNYSLYISYSWSTSKEIDSICEALKTEGIPYYRDNIDCGYRQNIRNFEREIGEGKFIIVFLSEKYIHSIQCMYELALISESGYIGNRVFPIVSDGLKTDLASYSDLVKYWNGIFDEKKKVLELLSSGTSLQALYELSYCDIISRELPQIWKYITEHNHLSEKDLLKDNCKLLINSIKSVIIK